MLIGSWFFYALLSAATAALVTVFGKMAVSHADSSVVATIRTGTVFVCLLLSLLVMGKTINSHSVTGRDIIFIVLSGVAGAASWLAFFTALKLGRTAQVYAVDRFSLVLVMIIAALFLGERLTLKSGLGAALMTAGLILIALA